MIDDVLARGLVNADFAFFEMSSQGLTIAGYSCFSMKSNIFESALIA